MSQFSSFLFTHRTLFVINIKNIIKRFITNKYINLIPRISGAISNSRCRTSAVATLHFGFFGGFFFDKYEKWSHTWRWRCCQSQRSAHKRYARPTPSFRAKHPKYIHKRTAIHCNVIQLSRYSNRFYSRFVTQYDRQSVRGHQRRRQCQRDRLWETIDL